MRALSGRPSVFADDRVGVTGARLRARYTVTVAKREILHPVDYTTFHLRQNPRGSRTLLRS